MTQPSNVAVVLAGGRAERFGRDKRFEIVDGEPLLHRAIRAVSAVTSLVVVVIGRDESSVPLPDDVTAELRIARDREPDQGPLAGLAAGLQVAPASTRVIVAAADMPSLQPSVLALLLEATADPPHVWTLEGPNPAIIGPLPLAGQFDIVAATARELVARGERSLRSLVAATSAARVPAAVWRALDPEGLTLRDIDRPGD